MSKPYMCGDETPLYIPENAACECAYTLVEVETDEYAAQYKLMMDGEQVGDTINIPLDKVVKSGAIKTVVADDVPYEGAVVGDKYIDLSIDNSEDHVYIPLESTQGITSAFTSIQATSGGTTKNYQSVNLSNTMKLAAGTNVSFTLGNDTLTVNASNSSAGSVFPVGSVYVTRTNSSPASTLGGSWALFDKEFAPFSSFDTGSGGEVSFNNSYANPNSGDQQVNVERSGHSIWIRFRMTNTSQIGEDEVRLCTVPLSYMGGEPSVNIPICLLSDTANGHVYGQLKANGEMVTDDVLARSGTSISGTLASGNTFSGVAVYTYGDIDYMDDSLCSKFYWRRTS